MSPQCLFRLLSESDGVQTVVCVHCGRPVTLKDAASRRILANCRGAAETRWKNSKPSRALLPKSGAGTELKKLLAMIGIEAAPNCGCNRRASEMDARGPEWCEQNINAIVGWLREEAGNRGLPFVDIAAKLLIKRAIHNARKAARADKME